MDSPSSSGRGEEEHKRDPFLVLEPPENIIKSPLTAKQFDVFINHRGPDTKTTLAHQIYHSLQQAGIRAYLDAPETELGDYIPSAIKNAISSALLHIAIFSPHYAESPWCLAELQLMFQTRATIIPLFYNVDPSDFRYTKNGVADAFFKHEEKGRYASHDIQRWKECLQNVSQIKGHVLNEQNGDWNKLCNDVVSAVVKAKQKRKTPLQVAKYEVGLDELVKDFQCHCQRNGEMRDKIIGICGMGGSGKTTLAKYLFNRKHSEFSRSTILFDVREKYAQGRLNSLQSRILDDLFPGNNENCSSREDGIAAIKDNLERSSQLSFLIVTDDVDHQDQLDALLSMDAVNPNSLVIVTTRDERLLINAGVRIRYKMKAMNAEHSRELFCYHAFHRRSCRKGFENLVDDFVQACGGLPLALIVMGGHVFGSNMAYWKSQLEEVKARLHTDIKRTLKISYDALEEDQKQIFMDIACFFIGEDVSRAMSIWKASGWRAEHALQILKDKCLVQVEASRLQYLRTSRHEKDPIFFLKMHDHLRDLGREVADKEASRPTEDQMSHPRRLWRPEDLTAMSEKKGFQDALAGFQGKSFRCYGLLRIPRDHSRDHSRGSLFNIFQDFHEDISEMRYFLRSSEASTVVQWVELDSHQSDQLVTIPKWFPLQNLHSIDLVGVSPERLCQRDDQVPLKLKELYCSIDNGQNSTYIKFSYPMVRIYLSALVSSLGRFKNLESLYIDFGRNFLLWNIEWNCLLKSVRELPNLQTLGLVYIEVEDDFSLSNRGETSDNRFCMRSLEDMILCNADNATKVSISGQFCPTLKSLKLCNIQYLVEVDLSGVITLERLTLSGCLFLREVFGNDLLKLEIFKIKYCFSIRKLPYFGRSCLKRIYISHCLNLQDVSAIERLKGLKGIWIGDCLELKSIKAIEQLKGLKRIGIKDCPKVEGVICFKELKQLKRIFIANCERLQSMEGMEFLTCLESIVIAHCPKLIKIGGVEELKGLKEMVVSDCPILSCAKTLQRLPSELTTMVGRSCMSYFNADKIGDTLYMADAICEIDLIRSEDRSKKVKGMISKFCKTNPSLKIFIFCAVVKMFPELDTILFKFVIRDEVKPKKPINLFRDYGDWVYICVGNEERLSEWDSWIEYPFAIEKAFLMGVEEGEERKTLGILQSLFAQLCIDTDECSEEELWRNRRQMHYAMHFGNGCSEEELWCNRRQMYAMRLGNQEELWRNRRHMHYAMHLSNGCEDDYNDLANEIEEANGCEDDDWDSGGGGGENDL